MHHYVYFCLCNMGTPQPLYSLESLLPGKDKRAHPQAAPKRFRLDIRKDLIMERIVKRENGLPRLAQSLENITWCSCMSPAWLLALCLLELQHSLRLCNVNSWGAQGNFVRKRILLQISEEVSKIIRKFYSCLLWLRKSQKSRYLRIKAWTTLMAVAQQDCI